MKVVLSAPDMQFIITDTFKAFFDGKSIRAYSGNSLVAIFNGAKVGESYCISPKTFNILKERKSKKHKKN